ncbi:MAG TPA: hypothetical protein VJR02_12115 [Pyrinomonadaceae bacterium]|nr:hypothetical protein [Pyrinomonadaceae bacterium]
MSFSKHVFQLLLLAYPREFRLDYGSEMTHVFCDCYRDSNSRGSLTVLWLRVIADVIRTAPLERWETFRKGETMRNVKRDVLGLLACLAITVLAMLLLGYVRTLSGSIVMVGFALDAIVVAGVISNLLIFVLMMTRRHTTFRTALWSLVIVNGALLLFATLLGMRVDPGFNFAIILASYIVSFLFWLTIHWIWSQIRTPTEPVA